MSQRRGTTTDNLNNVIQVIQLGRKTGVLTVERGDKAALETGEITFVYGQITHAYIGQIDGQMAVNWLCLWGSCRFFFTPANSERSTGPLPSLPHSSSNHITAPSKETHANISNSSTPIPDTISPPRRFALHHSDSIQPRPYRTVQADEALLVLEKIGLSRSHRRLLLLIDGQRTLIELERLTRRPLDEIQRLLYDLERIGVIAQ